MNAVRTSSSDAGAEPHRPQLSPRSELESCLREIAALPCADAPSVKWLREKLTEEAFNLVAAGQFKRGKSTAINALLGEPILPTGVVPLTSVVTVIRSGHSSVATAELLGGQTIAIAVSELPDYVTERGNPGNTRGVARVIIEHPSPWLANGVRLVDTPGIGSVYEHNTDETLKYLPQADAVLFVASVDQPLNRAELDFLHNVRPYASKVFCLLNKTDYLRSDELPEAVAFARKVLRDTLEVPVPVFPVSARRALEAKQGRGDTDGSASNGFAELESALRGFMDSERSTAWLQSIVGSLQRLLAQGRFAIDLESQVLQAPLERIEANLALFREEKRKAERARLDHQVLLEADARSLLKVTIEPTLDAFKRQQQDAIGALIEDWFNAMRDAPIREIRSQLEQRIHAQVRASYDGWLARQNLKLSEAFQALCARFWSSLQSTIDSLLRRSSELFGITFASVTSESRWSTQSSFYYKFWYEPSSLQILSSSTAPALPRFISGPMILKRSKRYALDLIEVHAGRIRHDLEERLNKSVQDAKRQMLSQIEATLTNIEAAIDNGMALRQRSSEYAGLREGQLVVQRRDLEALDERLKHLVA
jgi:Dynamin family